VDEDGKRLDPGAIGELVVRGQQVGLGYWQARTEAATRFESAPGGDRDLYTGDLGWTDREGFIYLLGRKDHMLKHHGIRLSPLELERAACSIRGVEAAAALKAEATNQLHLLVSADTESLTAGEVIAELRQLLEPHKIPDEVHIVTELPRNNNGKIDR